MIVSSRSAAVVVITGGSGYLGLRLAEQLVYEPSSAGYSQADVVLVDTRPPDPVACSALVSAASRQREGSSSSLGPSGTHSALVSSMSTSSLSSLSCSSPFARLSSTQSGSTGHGGRSGSSSWGSQDMLCFRDECEDMPHCPGGLGGSIEHAAQQSDGHGHGAQSKHLLSVAACTLHGGTDHVQLAPGVLFVAADLRDAESVARACRGADVVFHLASAGMSGAESMAEAFQIYDVNVKGTANVIAGCLACHVRRLVYVSTCNVAFDWTDKIGLDEESAEYVSHHTLLDTYSVTKSLAEQLVLLSNGLPLLSPPLRKLQAQQLGCPVTVPPNTPSSPKSGIANEAAEPHTLLRTCALRPPGIWGPGELRHTPRILRAARWVKNMPPTVTELQGGQNGCNNCRAARRGLLLFTFGDGSAASDWIHVDNLVDALLRAALGLDDRQGGAAAGKAYFVSDGPPINNFMFFNNFLDGLGYRLPRLRLPWRLVLAFSIANELLHLALLPIGLSLPLLICPAEVYKTSVPHYFKIDRARRDLGFIPKKHSMAEAIEWYQKHGYAAHNMKSTENRISNLQYFLINVLQSVLLWSCLGFIAAYFMQY